jgi:hypothetical protein
VAPAATIGLIFLALAAIFLVAALRHYVRADGMGSPARRTWLRIAVIFAVVGVGLQLIQRFAR